MQFPPTEVKKGGRWCESANNVGMVKAAPSSMTLMSRNLGIALAIWLAMSSDRSRRRRGSE